MIFLLLLFSVFAQAAEERVIIYGNHIYDDEAIFKAAGIDYNLPLSDAEIRQKLETTGLFSSVRIVHRPGRITILVQEKSPAFVLPYFSSSSDRRIYGIAGGLMGVGGEDTMLLGRYQIGNGNHVGSLLFRDEFFLQSFWILGASIDFEDALHDVYSGRTVTQSFGNKATSFTLNTGYHLAPDLFVQFDTHLESHRFEKLDFTHSSGQQFSHRILAEIGSYYLNEGLAHGYKFRPYFEFTNPLSDYKFLQVGLFAEASVAREGNFNWITRPRFEAGNPLPLYQQFELGGPRLRGFPSQNFRAQSYLAWQNDFLLTAFTLANKVIFRPMLFADWAYIESGGHTGLGGGLEVFFRNVAVPALQIYTGYGAPPHGFSFSAAIGPQI